MSIDAQTRQYLMEKKICQLGKIVEHLNYKLEKIKYQNLFFITDYSKNIDQLEKNFNESMKAITQCVEVFFSPQYSDHFNNQNKDLFQSIEKFRQEFETFFVNSKADLDEEVYKYKKVFFDLNFEISFILQSIVDQSEEFNRQISIIRFSLNDKLNQLNSNFQHSIHSNTSIHNLDFSSVQNHTNKQLDQLEKSFKSSINELKVQFVSNKNFSTEFQKIKNDIKNIHRIIITGKKSFISFMEMMNLFMREYHLKISNFKSHLRNISMQYKEEEMKLKDEIQSLLKNDSFQDFSSLKNNWKSEIEALTKQIEDEKRSYDKAYRQIYDNNESLKNKNLKDFIKEESKFQALVESAEYELQHFKTNHNQKIKEIQKQIDNENSRFKADFQIFAERHIQENQVFIIERKNLIDGFKEELSNILQQHNEKIENIKKNSINRTILDSIAQERLKLDNFIAEKLKLQKLIPNVKLDNNDSVIENLKCEIDNQIKLLQEKQKQDILKAKKEQSLILSQHNSQNEAELDELQSQLSQQNKTIISLSRSIQQSIENEKILIQRQYLLDLSNLQKQLILLDHHPISTNKQDSNELKNFISEKKLKNEEVSKMRKALIQAYETEIMSEEDRHSFANVKLKLINQPNDIFIIKQTYQTKFDKLNFQINELAETLKQLSVPIKKTEVNFFQEQEKELRKALENEELKSKKLIEEALLKTQNLIKDINNKIDEEQKEYSIKFTKYQGFPNEADQFDTLLDQYDKNKSQHYVQLKSIKDDFSSLIKSLKKSHNIEKLKLQSLITNQINSNQTLPKILPIPFTEDNYKSLQKEHDEFLKSADLQKSKIEKKYLPKIQKAETDLANAKKKMESNESRPKDLSTIARLEGKLKLQNDYLKTITKDINQYKKDLINQEGIYQSQFGTSPVVGVCRPTSSQKISRTLSQNSKRPHTSNCISRRLSFQAKLNTSHV